MLCDLVTLLDALPGDQVLFLESQVKQFQNFILRANRYPSLAVTLGGSVVPGGGASVKNKVVLVEVCNNIHVVT